MTGPESTRVGWAVRWFGVSLIGLAIGLVAWDTQTGNAIWPVNLITFACGLWNIRLGGKMVRRAREHHQFMEGSRARLQDRWPS